MRETLLAIESFTPFVEGLDHPECVTWGPDGYVYAGGEAGQIYRISLDGACRQIAATGGFILGLCLDAAGHIYACDQGRHAVLRIAGDGSISTYSAGAPGRPMMIPNYAIFDARGNLYVTDSGGWHAHDGCLFCIKPTGETAVVSEAVSQFPNGIALSPDGRELYVVLSNTSGVVRLSVYPDGRVGPPQPVVTLPRTIPDGLAFDVEGNLYIACYTPDVIYRLAPDGDLAILAEDWQSVTFATPTNIAFCGDDRRTLVVSSLSRWHLTKGMVPVAGQPLIYPQLD
jgi:gluconolactonase